jgi:septal ring factor EnvC (AmiA/AmiB activator)
MTGDKRINTVHVTEEHRIKYSVMLIRESMKRQREELAMTKAEIPRLQKRCKAIEQNLKQLEKLIKSAPTA